MNSSSRNPSGIERRWHQPPSDVFLREGYAVLVQIRHLQIFISKTRTLYLDTHKHVNTPNSLDDLETLSTDNSPLAILHSIQRKLQGLRTLNDDQRNQIDLTVRTFIEGLLKRIKGLELIASKRPPVEADKKNSGFLAKLGFLDLVSGSPAASRLHEALILEHKRSIIWLLQKRLMEASEEFQTMQTTWLDVKVKRQLRLLLD
ncbi:hypothetical protein BC829DRAFT_386329 [Chytridium lagenaria]|nr:hypothetical protein BC829DRAFT_386329 [Chytridium lagenaria]